MTNECFGYIKYKLPLTLNLPASFYFAIWLPEHLNCLPHRPPVLCFLATPGSSEQSWSKGTAIGLCVASALQPVMFDCGVGKIENLSIRTLKVFHSLKRWESLTAHLHMVFSSSYQYKKKKPTTTNRNMKTFKRAGQIAQWLRPPEGFQRTQVGFPALTW